MPPDFIASDILDQAISLCPLRAMPSCTQSGLERCIGWYSGDADVLVDPAQHCPTRDVFEGRLTRVLILCERQGYDSNEAALLTAVLGEIGNNSFDHNLSGRHPERRGNGLKFARSVINASAKRGLVAVSGSACLDLGGLGGQLYEARSWPVEQDRGTLMALHWSFA